MELLCNSCGYVGGDFATRSESEILRLDAAGGYEFNGDIEVDLSHVGELQCPQCGEYDWTDTDDVADLSELDDSRDWDDL